MRQLYLSFAFVVSLATCLCSPASGQQIQSMKLLAPRVGWAATSESLFWTTDGGAHWKDITPRLNHKWQAVSSVYFLDASTGWVLLNCADRRNEKLDDTCFEVASTSDGGGNWSVVHPKIVDPDPESGFSGRSFLDFADAIHGWMILKISKSVAASSGVMFTTEDGGRTWKGLASPPIADRFHFVTSKDGWLAGGPDLQLYATRDGGESWRPVKLKLAAQLDSNSGYSYDLPSFTDSKHGFLAVTVSGVMASKASVILFSTDDGGRSWKPSATLGDLPNVGYVYPTAICDSLVVAAVTDKSNVTLEWAEAWGTVSRRTSTTGFDVSGVQQLSFASPAHGWLLTTFSLLSTSDGGSHWSEVTPSLAEHSQTLPHTVNPAMASAHSLLQPRVSPISAPATGNVVSRHLGFDTFPTPSSALMQSWWKSSPYYDIFIYLYGSPNKSTNKSYYPTNSWLTTVRGYGWGVIPIWFGLQSSCIINQPNVTKYFGPTTQDASTQGAEEADQAIAAAQQLGITGTIIYHDIENYTVNGTCSPVVQAFVDGWDSEVHLKGYVAGIYANPGPIKSDISNKNITIPDEIWITKTPGKGLPPQVTIWNQGFSDILWPSHQRKHQFLIDQTHVIFGGTGLPGTQGIDDDIDDALAGNPVGSKTFNYPASAFTTVNYPGATNATGAYEINDINSGTSAFINGNGQIGEIVGFYQSGTNPFFVSHGFQDNSGNFTEIDYPSAQDTWSFGINNANWIVGQYFTGAATLPYLDEAGNFSSNSLATSCPTTMCAANGVNDAGQVVGYYIDSSNNYHSFFYYTTTGVFTSPYPTTAASQLYGINGQGEVVGTGTPCPDANFLYDNGTVTCVGPPGATYTVASAINNNGQVAGYYLDSNGQHLFLYDQNTGTYTTFDYPNTSVSPFAFGINDFGQVVGCANCNNITTSTQGFLAVPQ
jgi:photosystem II stability/assembly factor-like uncharacterized protein